MINSNSKLFELRWIVDVVAFPIVFLFASVATTSCNIKVALFSSCAILLMLLYARTTIVFLNKTKIV